MESLSGKIAAVTGGSRGIGRAIAERLLRDGASVAICGRSGETLERAAAELAAHGAVMAERADISDPAQVNRFFQAVAQRFGGLDILVNNAAEGVFRKTGEMSVEEWHRNIDANLNGAFYCSREALSLFRKRGGGFIVNISSLAGKNAFSGGAGYNASKFGLNGLSDALMLDHRYDNVRVCCVMPGSVETDFARVPSKRAGGQSWMMAPEDVAEVVSMALRMPARTMVSCIEMRPSQPQR